MSVGSKTLFKFWKPGITIKITLLIWVLIILSLVLYVWLTIPYQRSIVLDRMKTEAQDAASSFEEANKSSLITEDYQMIVDYSMNTLKNSSSIKYVVVAKNDGQTLFFKKNSWDQSTTEGFWVNPGDSKDGEIIYSDLINSEVFHYSKQFVYTGVNWGWIHIGLSTENFYKSAREMTIRAILFALIIVVLSFFVAYMFSKRLTKPISDLAKMAVKIKMGDLTARVSIQSADELGMLADSFNKMTESVSKSQETLENKVSERTNELAKTNVQLTSEIEERKKTEAILNQYTTKLQTLEEIYKGIISSKSPVEIFKNSAQKINDNLVQIARSSSAIFDYTNSSAVLYAFNFKENIVIETEGRFPLNSFSSFKKLQTVDFFWVEDLNGKVDKSEMEKIVLKEGIKSYICVGLKYQAQLIGELNFAFSEPKKFDQSTLDTILEISNQIAVAIVQLSLEEKLKHHAEELQNSLVEKEVLLKEIHHRVKNNLQIITSLLYLQSLKIDDEATQAIFKDSQNRVKSLALVHEKLYQSKDLARIDFSDYLKNLSNFIFTTYKTNVPNLHIDYDLDEVFLSVEVSVPLGLIVNELLSNALKYAFSGNQIDNSSAYKIRLKLKKLAGTDYILSISDNGAGLPDNFNIEESESLGLKLVTSLIQQIDGKLEIHPKNDTEFKISFNGNVF